MSEHYYRVGDKRPEPNQWIGLRLRNETTWMLTRVRPDGSISLAPDRIVTLTLSDEWFPVEAPPSELAPEPEDQGVEVDGYRYRFNRPWVERRETHRWVPVKWPLGHVTGGDLSNYGRVAQALGLVDQPPVPRALVDTVRRWADEEKALIETRAPTHDQFHNGTWAAYRRVLSCLERGEFGPVELSVEWVTDRLPNDDEYPVAYTRSTVNGYICTYEGGRWDDMHKFMPDDGRWVSLSVLLDAAGLGER